MQGNTNPSLHNLGTYWSKLSCLIFSLSLNLDFQIKVLAFSGQHPRGKISYQLNIEAKSLWLQWQAEGNGKQHVAGQKSQVI